MSRIILGVSIEEGIKPAFPRGIWGDVFTQMKDGESFFVPTASLQSCILTAAKRAGVLASSEKQNGGGFRIWRVCKTPATGISRRAN